MTNRIFIVEDDNKLIQDAQKWLDLEYQDTLSIGKSGGLNHDLKLKYELIPLELPKALDVNYWGSWNIKPNDCVVLDLHYGNYVDPHTQKRVKVPFNGRDVLKFLAWNKANGTQVSDLERVLIATSLPLEVDPAQVHPEIGMISGFDVYGMEKGKNKKEEIVEYGMSLLNKLDAIYEIIFTTPEDREVPLNYGWRSDNDVKDFKRPV